MTELRQRDYSNEILKLGLTVLFVISLFLPSGIMGEAVSWMCLVLLLIGGRKRVIRRGGVALWRGMFLYVAALVVLFLLQIAMNPMELGQILRLFGLTKCMCAPVLFACAFCDIMKGKWIFRLMLVLLSVFNLVYLAAHLKGLITLPFLGSQNVILGIYVVLFPLVCYTIKKERSQATNLSVTGILCVIFLLTGFVDLVLFFSATALAIFALQVVVMVIVWLVHRRAGQLRRYLARFMALCICAVIAFVLLIAYGVIKMDGTAIGTRVSIWTTAIRQMGELPVLFRWIGSGNDIVSMVTKDLEAHSVVVEMLMIYGIIGLVVFVAAVVLLFVYVLRHRGRNLYLIVLTMISYLLVCMIHPFFTGVFAFQWFCVCGFMYLINKSTVE